jgi:hypothetical protein
MERDCLLVCPPGNQHIIESINFGSYGNEPSTKKFYFEAVILAAIPKWPERS